MQKAAFSIAFYRFDKVNIDLSNHKTKELSLEFETKGVFIEATSVYELVFSVKAFNQPFIEEPFVNVQCTGAFKFDNVNSFEEIPEFFFKNSIAILYPYLRAYVSMITVQANVPGIMLPILNLSSLESELKQNTIIQ